MNYASRIIAVVVVIGWSLWSMSKIGEVSTCDPINFWSALMFSVNMAAICAIGFVAGMEQKK